MADRKADAIWSGNPAVTRFVYTQSHGIQPGVAEVEVVGGSTFGAAGNLIFTDGVQSITLYDCKLESARRHTGQHGIVDILHIVDRRWRWRELNTISGEYNQRDNYDKLIPWTIKSPTELCHLCLRAMGETNYLIDMPSGLNSIVGKSFASLNPPWIGAQPTRGTNPAIYWDNELPAVALANLCELFGRRVILQVLQNRVLITRPGLGTALPNGSISSICPSVAEPDVPNGVGVIGAPIRYQARFKCEAVALEWDDSYRPINHVSYAPVVVEKPQIDTVIVSYDGTTDGLTYHVYFWASPDPNDYRTGWHAQFPATGGASTSSTIATGLAASLNANAAIAAAFTAVASSGTITITGKFNGQSASIFAEITGTSHNPNNSIGASHTQYARTVRSPWDASTPPNFDSILNAEQGDTTTGTDRLTYAEARDRAQKSVYRCYRIVAASLDGTPFRIPGYPGRIDRIQQILLTPNRVEQITPQQTDLKLQDGNNQPMVVNFYNGHSRDKPAAAFGAVYRFANSRQWWHDREDINTKPGQFITVPFTIVPEWQMIVFAAPVCFVEDGVYKPADIILETAVYVRNADTNEVEKFKKFANFNRRRGTTNIHWQSHPDIQANVLGTYKDKLDLSDVGHAIIDPTASIDGFVLNEADPITRADYYLKGMMAQYIAEQGQVNVYNGIVGSQMDGAIMQITWAFGEFGIETTMSRNTEHSVYVEPYPLRRKAEFLPAARMRSRNNRDMISPTISQNTAGQFDLWGQQRS